MRWWLVVAVLGVVALAGCADGETGDSTGETDVQPPDARLVSHRITKTCEDILGADRLYFEPADAVMYQVQICWAEHIDLEEADVCGGRRFSRCTDSVVYGWTRDAGESDPYLFASTCQPPGECPTWTTDREIRFTWLTVEEDG